jgi:hypothetical protein
MNILASLLKLGQRRFVVLALAGGIAASGTMVWTASTAAFTASTANPTNTWTTASVLLHDDDTGSAMFNMTAGNGGLLVGGAQTGSRCIRVTYDGTVSSTVKLFVTAGFTNPATNATNDPALAKLGDYIHLTVEQGTQAGGGAWAGGAGGCAGFVKDDNAGADPGDEIVVNDMTLTAFAAAHTTHANGAEAVGGVWTPTAAAQSRVFRFTWDSDDLPDNEYVQGKTFIGGFTWQAKS